MMFQPNEGGNDDDPTNNEEGKQDNFVSAHITERMDSMMAILTAHAKDPTLFDINDNNNINLEY